MQFYCKYSVFWIEILSHGKHEKNSQLEQNSFQDCSQGTKGQYFHLALQNYFLSLSGTNKRRTDS